MNSFSFPKSNRLLDHRDFYFDGRRPKVVKNEELVVFYQINDKHLSRIGITISGNVAKSVVRNRLKRKIREWFRNSDFRNKAIDFNVVLNKKRVNLKHCKKADLSSFELRMISGLQILLNKVVL